MGIKRDLLEMWEMRDPKDARVDAMDLYILGNLGSRWMDPIRNEKSRACQKDEISVSNPKRSTAAKINAAEFDLFVRICATYLATFSF